MVKYFDNILFYLQKSGGGSVYWGELIKRFNQQEEVNFIRPDLNTSNIVLRDLSLKNVTVEKKIPLRFLRYLPLTIKVTDKAIFHSSYYRFSNQVGVKNIVTVHDFIYERFGNGIPRLIHTLQKGIAVQKACGIICISQSTKTDLLKYFPDKVRGKNIEVIYNGVSDSFFELKDKFSLIKKYPHFQNIKYVLFVGHRTHYKNFKFTIQVIKELPVEYKLLIVGNHLSDDEKQDLMNNIPNKFDFMGNITNEELNEVYNISHCLLYPSNYEGFGIPVIEAFKSGCPVVAQDIPVLNEISGDVASLVNGLDLKKFKEAIMHLSIDKERCEKIKLGLIHSKRYSWAKCFEQVNDFYNNI